MELSNINRSDNYFIHPLGFSFKKTREDKRFWGISGNKKPLFFKAGISKTTEWPFTFSALKLSWFLTYLCVESSIYEALFYVKQKNRLFVHNM